MSFGIHFGELVALHRGEQGLSQSALAIRAFDDESRKPRISELERGKVDNPAIGIVDALTVALNLSPDSVSACRTKGRQRTGVLTFEQHEKNARERVAEAEEKLRAATEADRALIEAQLAEAQKRAADLEVDFARKQSELDAAHDRLARLHNEMGDEKIEAAKRALDEGNTKLADTLFEEADEKLAAQVEDMNAERARLLYERGKIAEDEIRWHDADEHYGEAARLAPTYDNLFKAGTFAWKTGDYQRQSTQVEAMLRAAQSEFDKDDPKVALALNEVAFAYAAQGRYAEAEPLFRRALEIDEKALGPDHPDTAIDIGNLAGLLIATGRLEEATPLRNRELAIMEASHGPNHPHIAIASHNLAALLQTTGRSEEAEPLYQRAIKIFRASLGGDHPNTKKVIANYETFKAKRDKS